MKPYDALDFFLDDARAGQVSDAYLAEHADVSLRQVQMWKETRGLVPDKEVARHGLPALVGFVATWDPAAHQTKTDLDFEIPEFVVRHPLDYTSFARCCFVLYREAMLAEHQIAKALGVRSCDVAMALAMWQRHLGEIGQKCLGCDAIVDPRFGSFCSRTCHDQNLPRSNRA